MKAKPTIGPIGEKCLCELAQGPRTTLQLDAVIGWKWKQLHGLLRGMETLGLVQSRPGDRWESWTWTLVNDGPDAGRAAP